MTARKTTGTTGKPRRTSASAKEVAAPPKKESKLDLVVASLARPGGASLAELVAVTGWQPHSVRGALAGTLKKKGHAIASEKIHGERRYRIGAAE